MKNLFLPCFIIAVFACFNATAKQYYWNASTGNWNSTTIWKIGSFGGSADGTYPHLSTDSAYIGNGSANATVTLNISDTVLYLAIEGTGQIFINTSNSSVLSVWGNMDVTNSNNTGGGSATIKISGTGSQTLTGGSSSGIGKLPNLKVDKSSGTITLSGYITMGGSTTLTYTNGTVDAGTSTVAFYFSNTIAGTWTFYDVEFQGTGGTFSVSHNITVSDTLKITGTSGYAINSDTINLNGNLRVYNTSTGGGGSTVINVAGSGSQTIYSANTTDGKSYLPYMRINKGGDTLHLHGVISVQQGWSNNYSASKIKYDNTAELCFYWANSTCPIGGLYSTPIYRLALGAGPSLSGSNCTFNITRDSAFIVEDTFKQATNQNCTVNNHSLILNGPVYSRVGASTGSGGGSATYLINGNKTQTLNCVTPSTVTISFPSLKVQKSGGKLYLYGNVGILGNWTNNFSKDSIIPGTSRCYVWNNNATSTIGGTYPTRFYKFYVGAGNITYNFTCDSAVIVTDTFYFRNGGNYAMNNHSVVAYGDLVQEGGGGAASTPTEMILKGSNNQKIRCASATLGGWFPSITIQKTSGTVSLSGYIAIAGDWTNNYSTSNISYGTARIYSGLSGHTTHWGGSYPTPVHELVLLDGTITFNLTHDSAFIVKDTLWMTGTSGAYTMTGSSLVVQGNIVNSNTYVPTFGNTWIFGGSNNQTLAGANGMNLYDMKMNKASGTLTIKKPIAINHSLVFTKGVIKDSATLVTFNNSATVSGASDSGFVSGPVKKVGNQAFTFPTGKGSHYNSVAISSPTTSTDAFTAEYFNSKNNNTTLDASLTYTSPCEYWNLTHNTGSNTVNVTLNWNSPCFYIPNLNYVKVGYVSSGTWFSAGGNSTSGNTTNGSITTTTARSTWGDISLAKNNTLVVAHAGSDAAICNGASTTIGASPAGTGGTGTKHYAWSPSTGLSSSTSANPTANPTTTTTYILTVTDSITEYGKDTMVLTVNPVPGNNAGSNKVFCSGSATTIGSGSTGGHTYNWSPSTALSSSTVSNPTASPTVTTTYTSTETITTTGCSVSHTVTVSVNSNPSFFAGNNIAICAGSSTTIGSSPSASGGTAPYNYSWSPATALTSSTVSQPVANPTTNTTYTVIVTDNNNCTSTSNVIFTYNVTPINYYWVPGSTNNWSDNNNWRVGSYSGTLTTCAPSSGDIVNIGNGIENDTVFIDGNFSILELTIEGSGQVLILPSTSDTLSITGDITNNNTNDSSKLNTNITLNGTTDQSISGTNSLNFFNISIDKAYGLVLFNTPIYINSSLTLTKGIIKDTLTTLLTFNNGATVNGASDSSFVSGPVKKIGNAAFTFPIGKGSYYNPIVISAPSSLSDEFTSEYFNTDYGSQSLDTSITFISNCEYWKLDRNSGVSDVSVTLSWNQNSCATASLSLMKIGVLNGGSWISLGDGGTTGNTQTGTIITQGTTSTYGYFTIGGADGGHKGDISCGTAKDCKYPRLKCEFIKIKCSGIAKCHCPGTTETGIDSYDDLVAFSQTNPDFSYHLDTIIIPRHSQLPNSYSVSTNGVYNDHFSLFGIGEANNFLDVINLDNLESQSFPLDSISGYSSNSNTLGIAFANDTIYLVQDSIVIITKIVDTSLVFLDKHKINNESTDCAFSSFKAYSQPNYNPYVENGNLCLMNINYLEYANTQAFYKSKNEVKIHFNTSKPPTYTFNNISYPTNYLDHYYGLNILPGRIIGQNGNHVYFYSCSDSIHIWNNLTNEESFFYSRSYYKSNEIRSLDTSMTSNIDTLLTHVVTSPLYTQMLYDSYRNIYYRFFRPSMSDTSIYPNKPLVIMILDSNFNTLDELYLNQDIYEEGLSFVGPAGLYLSCAQYNNSDYYSADYLSYNILSFSSGCTECRKEKVSAKRPPLEIQENDNNGYLTLTGSWNGVSIPTVFIYSLEGKLIYKGRYVSGKVIDLHLLPEELYFVKVSDQYDVWTKKWIIKD